MAAVITEVPAGLLPGLQWCGGTLGWGPGVWFLSLVPENILTRGTIATILVPGPAACLAFCLPGLLFWAEPGGVLFPHETIVKHLSELLAAIHSSPSHPWLNKTWLF